MTSPAMEHIPLMSAYLCQDCDCVGNSSTSCPACASRSLLGLASVLNREGMMVQVPKTTYSFSSALAA
jgi:hypothetical protein